MNALAEHFIGSVTCEALYYYLLFSEKQIMRILQKYIEYYNLKLSHQ